MAHAKAPQRWLAYFLTYILTGVALAEGNVSTRVALQGYDPVAYFTEGHPVQGTPDFQQDWDGVRYYFSSAKNREAFGADPDKYAPQFSGYCSASVGQGRKNEGSPLVWKIVNGKLYVFGKPGAWVDDPLALARSHAVWPSLK